MSTPMDEVERLLNSGVELPDDPAELAALLEGQEPVAEKMGDGPIDPDPDLGDPKQTKAPPEEPEEKPEEKPTVEDTDPKAADASPDSPPPPAVLRETRQRLHLAREERDQEREAREKAERENAELRARLEKSEQQLKTDQTKLQEAADTVAVDAKVDLDTDSEAAIKAKLADYDDDIVGVVLDLAKKNAQLAEELKGVKVIADTQAQREQDAARNTFEEALNQNPLVALLRDDESPRGNELWDRAVSYDKALQADPDWADKSMVERFAEVDRRMRGFLGEDGVKSLLGETDPKPSKQPKVDPITVAEPVPSSLSDLPSTGRPTTQSESEQLDAMSPTELQDRIDKVLESGGDVDAYLSKLMSSVET